MRWRVAHPAQASAEVAQLRAFLQPLIPRRPQCGRRGLTFKTSFANLLSILNPRINNKITAPEVRVIDDEGKNLDVMPTAAALELAKSKGLDLIEISANAKPPVARIMSFDKFRYQEEKKFKKQRVAQKSSGHKQVQVGVRTADNDLKIKAKKVNEFLNEGSIVGILLVVRGREKAHKDFAMEKLKKFLTMLEPHKVVVPHRFVMKGITIQVSK